MSRMSEPEPLEVTTLSVDELRAALGRQRAVNTELRTVIATQAELHQAALAARDARIAQLGSQVVVLADRVAQLERRAGRDSSNSGKPPSSDSPYTKTPRKARDRSLRGRSGRKPGKQPGAPGATLVQVPDPDHAVVCAPATCGGCGCDLADTPVDAAHKRQVFEAPPPPPRPIVTEYLVQARICSVCGAGPLGCLGRSWSGSAGCLGRQGFCTWTRPRGGPGAGRRRPCVRARGLHRVPHPPAHRRPVR